MTHIDPDAAARARAHIARQKADAVINNGASAESDAGQVAAVYRACDAAIDELAEKRKHLEDTGQYTTTGILERLRPEAERLAKELTTLNERVIAPRKERTLSAAQKLAEKRPKLEATPDDIALARNWAAMDSGRRKTEFLGLALSGKDLDLARALATAHPLVTGLSEQNRAKLASHFGPESSEEESAVLATAKSLSDAETHITQTVTKLGESV